MEIELLDLEEFTEDPETGYIFAVKEEDMAEIAIRDSSGVWHRAHGTVEDLMHFNYLLEIAIGTLKEGQNE